MPIHLLIIINLCKFIYRAWVIESYSLHHGCTLMHVCNCVWLLLVFVVDDIHIPLHVQQCMEHYTEGPDCARTCCLYSNAFYAQLPLLEWCDVCTLL